MYDLMLTGVLILFMTKMAWDKGQRTGNEVILDYMSHAPNTYRLFDRLLMKLDRKPFSYITWSSLAWGASMMLTYILILPTETDLLVFLVGVAACSMNAFIRQAPLFPLLALFVITLNPFLLFLIVFTKEQGLWLAGGYLFFTSLGRIPMLPLETGGDLFFIGAGYEYLVWIMFAGAAYMLVRVLLGKSEYSPDGAPFFTPPYVWKYLREKKPMQVVINLIAVGAIVFFTMVKGLLGIQMIVWTAALVCLFALWWEPQLWFPTFILILAGG